MGSGIPYGSKVAKYEVSRIPGLGIVIMAWGIYFIFGYTFFLSIRPCIYLSTAILKQKEDGVYKEYTRVLSKTMFYLL